MHMLSPLCLFILGLIPAAIVALPASISTSGSGPHDAGRASTSSTQSQLAQRHWRYSDGALGEVWKRPLIEEAIPHFGRTGYHLNAADHRRRGTAVDEQGRPLGTLPIGDVHTFVRDGTSMIHSAMEVPLSLAMGDLKDKGRALYHGGRAVAHAIAAIHHTAMHHAQMAARRAGKCLGLLCGGEKEKKEEHKERDESGTADQQ